MLKGARLFGTAAAGILMGLTAMPVSVIAAHRHDEMRGAGGWNPAPAHSSAGYDCKLPQGWGQVAQRRTQFVVFGEIHGTVESPAFVGNIACALAARGERILVAVEHLSIHDPALQSAWNLPHGTFEATVRQAGWAERKDGVGSEAMMGLLVYLHALKQQGRSVDIVAFSGAKDVEQDRRFSDQSGQGPHEAAQAENIRTAAAARSYDHVLVLVGNLHARKRPVERGGSLFRPMAMQLASPDAITTLGMKTSGGTHWGCGLKPGVTPAVGKPFPADAVQCVSNIMRGDAQLKRAPFISLKATPDIDADDNYDGFFWLGPVSASPPFAVPDAHGG